MKAGLPFFIFVAATALNACQTLPQSSNQAPGTFGDAVAPDERQPLGAGVGAYLGQRLGHALTPEDETLHDAAAIQALWRNTKGYGLSWHNRRTGASGTIVPSSRVERRGDGLCRQFHDEARLPGEALLGVDGTACLNGREWTVDF